MCEQNKINPETEAYRQKAMEHDVSDIPALDLDAAEKVLKGTYQVIEEAVVEGYKKIEDGVVGGYKRIETGVVEGFTKMTDKIVEQFLTREGETVEDAKKRMNGVNPSNKK